MSRDEAVYLKHVLDAISRIEEYVQGIEETDFKQNYLIQDGVIRQLEIIGEAVKRISNEIRLKYQNIPWQDIAGTRDKLIHQYFGVDIEKVWVMVKEDIPVLKREVSEILKTI